MNLFEDKLKDANALDETCERSPSDNQEAGGSDIAAAIHEILNSSQQKTVELFYCTVATETFTQRLENQAAVSEQKNCLRFCISLMKNLIWKQDRNFRILIN